MTDPSEPKASVYTISSEPHPVSRNASSGPCHGKARLTRDPQAFQIERKSFCNRVPKFAGNTATPKSKRKKAGSSHCSARLKGTIEAGYEKSPLREYEAPQGNNNVDSREERYASGSGSMAEKHRSVERPAEGTRARFVVVKERTSREFGWLLGKERRHESNSPSNGATAGFLCGQIGGHYAPKLGLNCGSDILFKLPINEESREFYKGTPGTKKNLRLGCVFNKPFASIRNMKSRQSFTKNSRQLATYEETSSAKKSVGPSLPTIPRWYSPPPPPPPPSPAQATATLPRRVRRVSITSSRRYIISAPRVKKRTSNEIKREIEIRLCQPSRERFVPVDDNFVVERIHFLSVGNALPAGHRRQRGLLECTWFTDPSEIADVNINLFVGTKIHSLRVIKRLRTNKLALIEYKHFDLHRVYVETCTFNEYRRMIEHAFMQVRIFLITIKDVTAKQKLDIAINILLWKILTFLYIKLQDDFSGRGKLVINPMGNDVCQVTRRSKTTKEMKPKQKSDPVTKYRNNFVRTLYARVYDWMNKHPQIDATDRSGSYSPLATPLHAAIRLPSGWFPSSVVSKRDGAAVMQRPSRGLAELTRRHKGQMCIDYLIAELHLRRARSNCKIENFRYGMTEYSDSIQLRRKKKRNISSLEEAIISFEISACSAGGPCNVLNESSTISYFTILSKNIKYHKLLLYRKFGISSKIEENIATIIHNDVESDLKRPLNFGQSTIHEATQIFLNKHSYNVVLDFFSIETHDRFRQDKHNYRFDEAHDVQKKASHFVKELDKFSDSECKEKN
ncbi:hypothetical protein WN51_06527 [Melipona quadrifasciata]|uniref:Uncharacterized protein n=1 Tax=Melipona quadrifasciata TaxID=166423 RepID=A0A0N0BCQ7_9HYME|nr:hypothetical protein WN51_06527 [Melipona quadrifasciata]